MDDKQSSLYPMFGTQPSHCPKLLKYHSFVSLFSVYNYTLSQITIMVDSEPPPELVNDAGEKQRSLERTTEPPHGNGGIQSGDKGLEKTNEKGKTTDKHATNNGNSCGEELEDSLLPTTTTHGNDGTNKTTTTTATTTTVATTLA